MKFYLQVLFIALLSFNVNAQNIEGGTEFGESVGIANTEIAIIPEPVMLIKQAGHFVLPSNIVIQAGKNAALNQTVAFLKERLSIPTGYYVSTVNIPSATATIKLILNEKDDAVIGAEGYHLQVDQKHITIKANKPAGLFYGVQSLLQLLPKEIESKEEVKGVKWTMPCVQVTDYPRLGWRGLMFDVARHYFTKDEVKQYIDAMVRYKYNILHLHLADDEGWRIEIPGLPELTAFGSKRGYSKDEKSFLQPSYGSGLLPDADINYVPQQAKITKTRYVDDKSNYMFLRVDSGENDVSALKLNGYIKKLIEKSDITIVSDYNKGFLTDDVLIEIGQLSKLSIIDSKRNLTDDVVESYSFVKLNEEEFSVNKKLSEKYLNKMVVTLGMKGAMYNNVNYPSPSPKQTIDVSGAGDTFVASFITKFYETDDVSDSIKFANEMASIVVSKRGVATPF